MNNDAEMAYYDRLHSEKYRDKLQSKLEHAMVFAKRVASEGKGRTRHLNAIYDIVSSEAFIPAGRVQAAMGAKERTVSAFNCAASQRIDDSMESIMDACAKAASILRLGTGIGYNFSHIRPAGDLIVKLQTSASGPISFMAIFDVMASTIASSGHRRGAQMGILNIDHPDIEAFIDAKMQPGKLRQFNISVGVTDGFMQALEAGADWDLKFKGKVYKTVKAQYLWDKIMHNAYNSSEPGVLFLDRMNKQNNLYYCEDLEITNPCSEQPLPYNGLCLLGSFNLVKYVNSDRTFNYRQFTRDMDVMVEAYDNIFEKSIYACEEHRIEAQSKRRMGIGLTSIANAIEYMVGKPCYGSEEFNAIFENICTAMRNSAYNASIRLASERGSFKAFRKQKYLKSEFIRSLPDYIRRGIREYGIRNSHLLSFAPCGTISQTVGNTSSGVEPIFYHSVDRDVYMKEGKVKVTLNDYMVRNYGFHGKTLEDCSVADHLSVLSIAQRFCDSSVSKTINVASSCTYDDYQRIYVDAYRMGSKGITVFRPTELRGAVIVQSSAKKTKDHSPVKEYVYGESASCSNGACSL